LAKIGGVEDRANRQQILGTGPKMTVKCPVDYHLLSKIVPPSFLLLTMAQKGNKLETLGNRRLIMTDLIRDVAAFASIMTFVASIGILVLAF
jgi:hypothetical protein